MAAPRVAMVAGEASGDLLAGLVLDGLRARWPGLQASGIGGPQMVQRGFQADWPSDKLAVHGYSVEVFRRLRELRDSLAVKSGMPLPELSMGMSHDFETAVEEGATLVRVGTALFGGRAYAPAPSF